MPSPLGTRRRLLGATLETTAGTAAAVVAGMAASKVYDLKMKPTGLLADGERRPAQGVMGTVARTVGKLAGSCSFKMELTDSDFFTTLAQACGFDLTTLTLTPESAISAQKNVTLATFEDGRKKILYGCSGTFTLETDAAGNRIMANFEFTGIWSPVTDVALPAFTPVLTTGFKNAGLTATIGGVSFPGFDGWSINSNSAVSARMSGIKASGLEHYFISDMAPTMTIGTEARLVADHDAYGKLLAGTTEAVQIVATAGSDTMTINAPAAQRIEIDDAEREGAMIDALDLELHVSAGEDALSIVFTT